MRKLFLFIVATFLATSLWAECGSTNDVDTIPAQRYLTDFKLKRGGLGDIDVLAFTDNFATDQMIARAYWIDVVKDVHSECMFDYFPYQNMGYYGYYYAGYNGNSIRSYNPNFIGRAQVYAGKTMGGYYWERITNLINICYERGEREVIFFVHPMYITQLGDYVSYYSGNEDYNYSMINYYKVTLPIFRINNISAPATAKYGQQFSITGKFRAVSQTTWNIQESTDGVKWDTKKAGSVTADQARAGVDVEYHRVMTDQSVGKLYFRLALRDKTTGIVEYSEPTEMEIQYPFQLNNTPVVWKAMDEEFYIPKLPDCSAYKISSNLGLDMKDEGSYYSCTMPGCPTYVWEETPTYTVTFMDADYTELSTQEVTCGDDAIAPELPSQAPARVKGQAEGGLTFDRWSADYTNVHKQLKVFAKYSLGGNYTFKAEQSAHTNSVHPMGFTGDEGRAMVGDSLTYQATITMPTTATLYYETCSRNADGSWTNWTAPTNNSVGSYTAEDVTAGQPKVFTQTVPVEYVSNYYERAWSHGFAFRFYVMCAGERIYSEPFEYDVYYPTSIRSRIADEKNGGQYEVLLAADIAANTGCFVNDSSCLGARYNDTVRIARPYNGEGACVIFTRVNHPDRPLESGIDDNGLAYFIAPGESEIIDVTVKRYAVVFDNVPGQSQQFDFSAEGFGKYNAYYAQVANCGSQVLAPEEPTVEGYIFKGWEAWDSNNANDAYLHIPSVSDSYLGFSAVWEALPTPPNYTVSFEDYDGTPLKSESVEQGENATPPSAPARAAHHFTGWDKSYTTVTENRTLVAQYGEDEVTWTVTYKNWDNSDLGTETVNDGEAAQGVIATREGYTLTGWVDNTTGDPVDLTHVTADITVKATFELNVYTITYTLDDAPVQTEQVNHGDMPTAYQAIESQGKPATEQYVYTFDHWDPAIVAATQDASYAAIFAQTLRQYVVTFQNWDHSPLKEEQVAYGHAATAPATPNRNVDYEFTGWDNDFSDVRTNLVVTAQFKMTDKDAVGTGIEDIRLDGSIAQKVLLDGTLYIIMPEGKVFNAQGTRVK